jgi:hypothetical protein
MAATVGGVSPHPPLGKLMIAARTKGRAGLHQTRHA